MNWRVTKKYPPFETVSEEETKDVIKCDDVELTLSPSVRETDIDRNRNHSAQVRHHSILVSLK